MATLTLRATYARSGTGSYTGLGSSSYIAIGKCVGSYADSGFSENAVYRGCLGFDLSTLAGATISHVTLHMQGADNLGDGEDSWVIRLSRSNTWNATTLTSPSVGTPISHSSRWYSRTLSGSAFMGYLTTLGSVGYLHIQSQSGNFKLWEGSAGEYASRPYLEIEYEAEEAEPEEPVENTITVSKFSLERCAYSNESGEWLTSTSGTRLRVSITASLRNTGKYAGNSIISAHLRFAPYGSTKYTSITLPWTSGTSYSTSSNLSLLANYSFSASQAYDLELALTDRHTGIVAYTSVAKSFTLVHFAGNKKGVAIGGYSTATEASPKFECFLPAVFYESVSGLPPLSSQGLDIVKGTVSGCSSSTKSVTFSRTLPGTPVILTSQYSGNPAAVKITGISESGFNIQSAASNTAYHYLAIYWAGDK